MKALILVGGEATRLLPLTCNRPKAMIPVMNRPFLEHIIGHLRSHGIKDIILTESRQSRIISDFFGDGSRYGVKLSYTVEDTPLGTAGAVKNAEEHLNDTFLMLNGDVFTDLDITSMVRIHLTKKAMVTIALTPVDDPTSYGLIETDSQGRILRFLEKPSWSEVTTNMINAGTYVMEPDALAYIPPQARVSIERETFPLLLNKGEPVYAYPSGAYWMDAGTPEKYLQLHRDLLGSGIVRSEFSSGCEVITGDNTLIHSTAQLKGPILIDSNCSIGRGVKLKGPMVIGNGSTIIEGTVIEDSVIWRNVRMEANVTLKNSIVADNCHLNSGCIVEGAVLGDNVTIAGGSRLGRGSKIEPGLTVESYE